MFSFPGMQEVIIVLIIALIFFGPKKLPEVGRSIGSALRELKKASNDVMNTLSLDDELELPKQANQRVDNNELPKDIGDQQ